MSIGGNGPSALKLEPIFLCSVPLMSTACRSCNVKKGARTPREWRASGHQGGWL